MPGRRWQHGAVQTPADTAVTVVITAHDQGDLVAEAVASARAQTLPPVEVLVVDDGGTDPGSRAVLDTLARTGTARLLRQENQGVSAARNAGIRAAGTGLVAVLDGDDRFAPRFLERTTAAMAGRAEVLAASGWLRLHGVVETVVRPAGGTAVDFLPRNACPAAAVLRRDAWQRCGGYDESMRGGFEDWDLFLSLLAEGGEVVVVPEPLVEYRTAPASANLRSMTARSDRYGHLVDKHHRLFARHLREVVVALDAQGTAWQHRWEAVLAEHPDLPYGEVTYGDGGMASAVRAATARAAGATATPGYRTGPGGDGARH